jgi:hypothetical protein
MVAATSVPLTGAAQVVAVGPALYRGFTLRETAGAEAVVRVWDNPSAAAGTLLDTVALPADGSATELHDGVRAATGVYVQVVSGTVEGAIRIG